MATYLSAFVAALSRPAATQRTVCSTLLVLLALVLPASPSTAAIRVTLGELDAALAQADDAAGNPLESLVNDALRRRLREANLALVAGTLVFQDRLENYRDDSGCTRTLIRWLDTRIDLSRDTALEFDLVSLDAPMRISLELSGIVFAQGRARQRLGVRIGSCHRLATDNFDIKARGPFALRLDIELQLRPEFVAPDRLRFQPQLTLGGDLLHRDIDVDVGDSLLAGLIEKLLLDVIEEAFSRARIEQVLRDLRASVASALDKELDDGAIELVLPSPDDTQVAALYELFAPGRPLALTLGHLDDRRIELLAAALIGDTDTLQELLGDAALCEALALLQVPLVPAPAWSSDSGSCQQVNEPPALPGLLYGDPVCQASFDFSPTDTRTFCATSLDTLRYGNGSTLSSDVARPLWTLSPGTRLELGATPLGVAGQPFTTRLRYRTVETTSGRCELEMRVHTQAPSASMIPGVARRPLIALHGGSWSARSTGALGLEASVLPFTEAGFVVFAPFYRLSGDREGPPACRGATLEDIESDAEAALDWVLAYAASFGAVGRPVLFGQSAGGHLAAALAFARSKDIERAALLYAPVDFTDFLNQARSGAYVDESGRRTLERVLDEPLDSIDIESPTIMRNSFPTRSLAARNAGTRVPPLFLLHGEMDELLPIRQSVRLCNALAGDIDEGPAPLAPSLTALRRIVSCDANSELHLIAEGDHALDLCVADGLCASGSPQSAALVADSLARLVDWAAESESVQTAAVEPATLTHGILPRDDRLQAGADPDSGSGKTSVFVLLWMLMLGLGRFAHTFHSSHRRSPS